MNKKHSKNIDSLETASANSSAKNSNYEKQFAEKLKAANETLKRIGLPNKEAQ
jgi:hypothetical protein